MLGSFDVVVFNHPHTGEPSIEQNQHLLKGFFHSAKKVVKAGARVAVTLKQTWPYSEWQLEACAREAGFVAQGRFDFPATALSRLGYTHVTTDNIPHKVEYLDSAKT